jgi:hypothetical protein
MKEISVVMRNHPRFAAVDLALDLFGLSGQPPRLVPPTAA